MQDAYIPKDPATAKQAHRGFGFVTFANADDVDKVLSCAHSISDQEIAVQCAIPKVIAEYLGHTMAWSWAECFITYRASLLHNSRCSTISMYDLKIVNIAYHIGLFIEW